MSRVRVSVPASCTNLGPGIDSLGLALTLHNIVEMWLRADSRHAIAAQGASAYGETLDHPALKAGQALFTEAGVPNAGFNLSCHGQIPPNCGLGDLAAWTVAGLDAANNLLERPLARERVAALACDLTGQPAAALTSLLGGLALIGGAGVDLLYRRLDVPTFKVVVVVPEIAGFAEKAQQTIPAQVNLADATFNIGRTALLVEALRSGDYRLLAQTMCDRLVEPRRRGLIPGFEQASEVARRQGATAVTVSGDGPALIAFTEINHISIQHAIQATFQEAGLASGGWVLNVDTQGVAISVRA